MSNPSIPHTPASAPSPCEKLHPYTSQGEAIRFWRNIVQPLRTSFKVYLCCWCSEGKAREVWHVAQQGLQDPLPMRPRREREGSGEGKMA